MKQPAPPTLREGDTNCYTDTITQVMLLPLTDNMRQNMKDISKGKKQFERWAKDSHAEIVGWQHDHGEHEGLHVLRLTMFGKMLRPELAYKGQYPVYENEREGYVAIN